MSTFRVHGWTVGCPEPLRARTSGAPAEIEFTFAPSREIPTELPDAPVVLDQIAEWGCVLVEREGHYLYRVPDYYEVEISPDGRQACVTWDSRDDGRLRPVLLAGGVLAICSTLAGRSCLHATAVAVDGGAVALVGPPGRGKTTTAGLLLAAGAAMIGDDIVAPIWDVDRFVVPTGLLELRFRDTAFELAQQLDAAVRRTTPDRRTGVVPARAADDDRTPLRAIVVPLPDHEGGPLQGRVLGANEAFLALTATPRLEGWKDRRIVAQEFDLAARLAAAVPVIELTIPWNGPLDVALGRRLIDALRSLTVGAAGAVP